LWKFPIIPPLTLLILSNQTLQQLHHPHVLRTRSNDLRTSTDSLFTSPMYLTRKILFLRRSSWPLMRKKKRYRSLTRPKRYVTANQFRCRLRKTRLTSTTLRTKFHQTTEKRKCSRNAYQLKLLTPLTIGVLPYKYFLMKRSRQKSL
jgi:hypothetical protein